MQGLWLPSSGACGTPHGPGRTVGAGADVLHLQQSTDTALLRLRRPAPAGAAFATWAPVLPALGTATVGLHHPLAGPQRLSTARVSGCNTCVEVDYCGADADPSAIGYVPGARRPGATSPGSSGSGLFDAAGRPTGTHLGGSKARRLDDCGRFHTAYRRGGLARWLGEREGERPHAAR